MSVNRSVFQGLVALPLLAALLGPGSAAAQTNLVQNPSFETGALAPGWTQVNTASGGAIVVVAGAPLGFGVAPALLPGNGTQEAVLQTNGPSTTILYQDVVLPAASSIITAQATVALVIGTPGGPETTDFYRVDIVQAIPATLALGAFATNSAATFAPGVLQPLYLHDRSASVASVDTPQVDLSAFAGQTVRIRAVVNANTFYTQGVLDNVRIIFTPNAVGAPVDSLWMLLLMVGGILAIGWRQSTRLRFWQ